jgi:hypothetical protein
VIPANGAAPLVADAAPAARVAEAAAAPRTAPTRHARRRLVLLVMMIVLPDSGRRGVRKPMS